MRGCSTRGGGGGERYALASFGKQMALSFLSCPTLRGKKAAATGAGRGRRQYKQNLMTAYLLLQLTASYLLAVTPLFCCTCGTSPNERKRNAKNTFPSSHPLPSLIFSCCCPRFPPPLPPFKNSISHVLPLPSPPKKKNPFTTFKQKKSGGKKGRRSFVAFKELCKPGFSAPHHRNHSL